MASESDRQLGHNGGPELEDDDPTGRMLFVKWAWTRAHDEAWKTPPLDILRFRVARAEAAGLTYREYMLQLLDTGQYPQAKAPGPDAKPKRPVAKPGAPNHSLHSLKTALPTPIKPGSDPVASAGQNTVPRPSSAAATTHSWATHVDSRVADARKPSPMTGSTLHKVHK
jgi:hypothetical protein